MAESSMGGMKSVNLTKRMKKSSKKSKLKCKLRGAKSSKGRGELMGGRHSDSSQP